MPYAQAHYPFENKERFDCSRRREFCRSAAPHSTFVRCFNRDTKGGVIKLTELSPTARFEATFPADFIAEGLDQVKRSPCSKYGLSPA